MNQHSSDRKEVLAAQGNPLSEPIFRLRTSFSVLVIPHVSVPREHNLRCRLYR